MSNLGKCNRTTKKTIAGIYLIKNKINQKVYVGKSLYVYQRLNQHKRELKANKHSNSYLQNSFNKYGLDNFEFIVYECTIENLPKEILNRYLLERELQVIDLLNSHITKQGYNIALDNYHYVFSKELCEKVKVACLDKNNKYYVATKDNKFIFISDLKDFCEFYKLNYAYVGVRKNLVVYKNTEYRFIKKWFVRYATKEEINQKNVLLFDNPEIEYGNKATWSKAEIPGVFYNSKQDYYEVSVCLTNKKYQLSRFRDEESAINCLNIFKYTYPNFTKENIEEYRKTIKIKKAENKGVIKKGNWFIARGQLNNKSIQLGKFLTEYEAKECYYNWKKQVIK